MLIRGVNIWIVSWWRMRLLLTELLFMQTWAYIRSILSRSLWNNKQNKTFFVFNDAMKALYEACVIHLPQNADLRVTSVPVDMFYHKFNAVMLWKQILRIIWTVPILNISFNSFTEYLQIGFRGRADETGNGAAIWFC